MIVYRDHLEGYAWGENMGRILLSTYTGGDAHTYGNTSATDYGVNRDDDGNLSGYAWGTNAGWINFDPDGGEGVTVDPRSGDFDGYAWGENVGWIHFNSPGPVPYTVPKPSVRTPLHGTSLAPRERSRAESAAGARFGARGTPSVRHRR